MSVRELGGTLLAQPEGGEANKVPSLGCLRGSRPVSMRSMRSSRLGSQQFRQLRYVGGNAPRFIERQHLCNVSLCACLAGIEVDERLTVGVENFEAVRYLLDAPGRWEPRAHQ